MTLFQPFSSHDVFSLSQMMVEHENGDGALRGRLVDPGPMWGCRDQLSRNLDQLDVHRT